MEKKEYRLKGHESFILREGWVTKGLRAICEDNNVFLKNSGADALGVGTNMAKAIRFWLRAAGLTQEVQRSGVALSELGKLIYQKDPYLEDIFSLWILHSNIVRNVQQTTSWNLFFNDIDVTSFNKKELLSMLTDKIIEYTGNETPSESSIAGDAAAILAMYTDGKDVSDDPEDKKNSPFCELGLLHKLGVGYKRTRPAINLIDPLVIYYLMANDLLKERVLSIDTVVSGRDMPGKILNMNRLTINDCLDALHNKEYIIVNRTAGLDVIYPANNLTAIEAIKKHYEGSSIQ